GAACAIPAPPTQTTNSNRRIQRVDIMAPGRAATDARQRVAQDTRVSATSAKVTAPDGGAGHAGAPVQRSVTRGSRVGDLLRRAHRVRDVLGSIHILDAAAADVEVRARWLDAGACTPSRCRVGAWRGVHGGRAVVRGGRG